MKIIGITSFILLLSTQSVAQGFTYRRLGMSASHHMTWIPQNRADAWRQSTLRKPFNGVKRDSMLAIFSALVMAVIWKSSHRFHSDQEIEASGVF